MWLLDSSTLQRRYFLSDLPPYAILSHTWGNDEVLFDELGTPAAHGKAGLQKIKQCCQQARLDGLEYVWIDTCCIDKKSSSELSEAVNSMFDLYKNAWVCYTFLFDLTYSPEHETAADACKRQFARCRWFHRGWTLQELLASYHLVFFDKDWVRIGTKATLLQQIASTTGIPRKYLLSLSALSEASVAQRMSWASGRRTTRIEDEAYSLLGIFGVNMPLLYGEGRNAFQRLQHAIIATSTDHSIFAWRLNPIIPNGENNLGYNILAKHTSDFRYSSNIIAAKGLKFPLQEIRVTNLGLSIELPILKTVGGKVCAILNCIQEGSPEHFLAVQLSRQTTVEPYARTNVRQLMSFERNLVDQLHMAKLYLALHLQNEKNSVNEHQPGVWVDCLPQTQEVRMVAAKIFTGLATANESRNQQLFNNVCDYIRLQPSEDGQECWAAVQLHGPSFTDVVLLFGFWGRRIWLHLGRNAENQDLDLFAREMRRHFLKERDSKDYDYHHVGDFHSYALPNQQSIHVRIGQVESATDRRGRHMTVTFLGNSLQRPKSSILETSQEDIG